jgi:hypothetical protein
MKAFDSKVTTNAGTRSFTANGDTQAIVMALVAVAPMWTAFKVEITPEGSVPFVYEGKKNMTGFETLGAELTAYFGGVEAEAA